MTYFVTGAIYLDAEQLWLSPAQREVIDEQPDYRSSYGATLGYSSLGRTRSRRGAGHRCRRVLSALS